MYRNKLVVPRLVLLTTQYRRDKKGVTRECERARIGTFHSLFGEGTSVWPFLHGSESFFLLFLYSYINFLPPPHFMLSRPKRTARVLENLSTHTATTAPLLQEERQLSSQHPQSINQSIAWLRQLIKTARETPGQVAGEGTTNGAAINDPRGSRSCATRWFRWLTRWLTR